MVRCVGAVLVIVCSVEHFSSRFVRIHVNDTASRPSVPGKVPVYYVAIVGVILPFRIFDDSIIRGGVSAVGKNGILGRLGVDVVSSKVVV